MYSTFSILSNLPTELAWWNVKFVLLMLLFILKSVYAKHQNAPILVLGSVLRANSSSCHHLPHPSMLGLSQVLPLLALSSSGRRWSGCFPPFPGAAFCNVHCSCLWGDLLCRKRGPLLGVGTESYLYWIHLKNPSHFVQQEQDCFKHFRKASLCRHNVVSKHQSGGCFNPAGSAAADGADSIHTKPPRYAPPSCRTTQRGTA